MSSPQGVDHAVVTSSSEDAGTKYLSRWKRKKWIKHGGCAVLSILLVCAGTVGTSFTLKAVFERSSYAAEFYQSSIIKSKISSIDQCNATFTFDDNVAVYAGNTDVTDIAHLNGTLPFVLDQDTCATVRNRVNRVGIEFCTLIKLDSLWSPVNITRVRLAREDCYGMWTEWRSEASNRDAVINLGYVMLLFIPVVVLSCGIAALLLMICIWCG